MLTANLSCEWIMRQIHIHMHSMACSLKSTQIQTDNKKKKLRISYITFLPWSSFSSVHSSPLSVSSSLIHACLCCRLNRIFIAYGHDLCILHLPKINFCCCVCWLENVIFVPSNVWTVFWTRWYDRKESTDGVWCAFCAHLNWWPIHLYSKIALISSWRWL